MKKSTIKPNHKVSKTIKFGAAGKNCLTTPIMSNIKTYQISILYNLSA
ncbi:MAG: hypothetical protein QG670_2532 [Thermoproteota archaeon]|nr:hypothetical protein [Thermoproteota archaeon]